MNRKEIIHNELFYYHLLKPIFKLISYFSGFRSKCRYTIEDGESVFIISNHQTNIDFMHIMPQFNKQISAIATDTVFSGKHIGNFCYNKLAMIPKKKGANDISTVKLMAETLQNGGNIILFIEGNRTYAEFQFYIAEGITRFLKKFKPTLILYKLEGGTGTSPRFMHHLRKGYFTGSIQRVLKYDEYGEMSDEELLKIIKDNIRQFDSESGHLYKSKKRAEYLEKMFFVCPKCNGVSHLYSNNETIKCLDCGLEFKYNEDLSLTSLDPSIKFKRLLDWWNYQKRFVKEWIINTPIIFEDDNIKLYKANPFEKKVLLYKGKMKLDKEKLIYGQNIQPLKDLEIASVVSGGKLSYQLGNDNFIVKSKNKRFNPLKYVLLFNKLDTIMKKEKRDSYFNLEED